MIVQLKLGLTLSYYSIIIVQKHQSTDILYTLLGEILLFYKI